MANRIHLDATLAAKTQRQRVKMRLGLIALAAFSLIALLGAQGMQVVAYVPDPDAPLSEGSVVAVAKCPGSNDSVYTHLTPVLYKNRHGNVTRYWVEPTSPEC